MEEQKSSVSNERDELIKEALKQPGIADLMEAYGRYDEYIKQAEAYLSSAQPKNITSTTDSTS